MNTLTHHLAPYHDLAIITAISIAIFVFVCWAMRHEGEL